MIYSTGDVQYWVQYVGLLPLVKCDVQYWLCKVLLRIRPTGPRPVGWDTNQRPVGIFM